MKFHQALFGYDTGHHLLSTSLPLSTDARHELAVATDLSGSAPPEGFDAAYTGLPLTGTNFYALFCTWLAPEMPRPGCVWSHVIFIELAEFAQIEDLGSLRSVFRRPSPGAFNEYQLQLAFRKEDQAGRAKINTRSANALVAALYGMSDRRIVVPTKSEKDLEDLIFALWSQQWPRLRRTFKFSTGSFADRGRSGTAFDLQISPEANRRAWQRGTEYLLLDIKGSGTEVSYDLNKWIPQVLDDLITPDAGGFRTFLRSYGADLDEPRPAFQRLASTYQQLVRMDTNDWGNRLEAVAEVFGSPSEALALKTSLISPGQLRDHEQERRRNVAIACFLLTSNHAAAYENVPVDFSKLGSLLWHAAKKESLALLGQLVRQQERAPASSFATAVVNPSNQPNSV